MAASVKDIFNIKKKSFVDRIALKHIKTDSRARAKNLAHHSSGELYNKF